MSDLDNCDNCHNLKKYARERAKDWVRQAKRSGRPFEDYVLAVKKPVGRVILSELSTGSTRFKNEEGVKLSPFQRQFLQIAASQRLAGRKSSSV